VKFGNELKKLLIIKSIKVSRIGKQPVKIEEGVEVRVEGKKVTAKGPLGEFSVDLPYVLEAEIKDGEVIVTRKNEEKSTRSMHGTFRALINNAVKGVKQGYEKKLELVGTGYRARVDGNKLVLNIGFNIPKVVEIPTDLNVSMADEVTVVVKGVSNQKVGQFAAKVRSLRKPEPYKGKGIHYSDEVVRRKSSKAASVGSK